MAESLGEHTFVRHPTPLRAEPDDGAEQVTEALPGEPLVVVEARDGWARVRTAYDYPGWLRQARSAARPTRLARAERRASRSTTRERCSARRISGAA